MPKKQANRRGFTAREGYESKKALSFGFHHAYKGTFGRHFQQSEAAKASL